MWHKAGKVSVGAIYKGRRCPEIFENATMTRKKVYIGYPLPIFKKIIGTLALALRTTSSVESDRGRRPSGEASRFDEHR